MLWVVHHIFHSYLLEGSFSIGWDYHLFKQISPEEYNWVLANYQENLMLTCD